MSVRLIDSLATTQPLAELFSDESVLQAMLDFEAALARAQARTGMIPGAAAEAIAASAKPGNFDAVALAQASLRAGTPSIPLVKALTEHVRKTNPEAARFVHWGATSQDVADTAMSLLLRRAEKILAEDLFKLERALLGLAEQHEKTVMLGRTLLQPAPPVTFGLKAAGWLGAIARVKKNLRNAFRAAAILQFGGASGTLASLGGRDDDRGVAVVKALSEELSFEKPPAAPWHTQRDRLATLVCTCGVLTGSLGKMARDISLLMQHEIREAAEPGGKGRGGSSTMPHKHNPTACSLTVAAAHRVPGLVAAFLSAMVQEHERAVGGWQAEWPIIAGVVQSTGLAIASMAEVAEGISIDAARMRENIERTNGVIFAERAMMLLGAKAGRDVAHTLLEAATKKSVVEGRHLRAVLAEMPEVTAHLNAADLERLERPEEYVGSADAFRKDLISESVLLNTDADKEK
jgi:3-carboxy-cis,cis-muconate cycloisomerase